MDLFGAYGVGLRCLAAGAAEGRATFSTEFVSIAAFACRDLTGYIVMGARAGILQASNRTCSSAEDWMAELTNQFLGRLKNRLLREGILLHRMPAAIMGIDQAHLRTRTGTRFLTLGDSEPSVSIFVDIEPAIPGITEPVPEPEMNVPAEGELLLF